MAFAPKRGPPSRWLFISGQVEETLASAECAAAPSVPGAGTGAAGVPLGDSPPGPLQDESTGEITFYMKGADVVMAGIVQYNDWLEEEVSGPGAGGPARQRPGVSLHVWRGEPPHPLSLAP